MGVGKGEVEPAGNQQQHPSQSVQVAVVWSGMHVHDDVLPLELLAPAEPLDPPLEVALPPLLVLLATPLLPAVPLLLVLPPVPLLLLESSVPPDPLEPDPPSSFDELPLLLQAASPAVDEAPITTTTWKSFSSFMTYFVPRRTAAGRVRTGTRGIRGGKPTPPGQTQLAIRPVVALRSMQALLCAAAIAPLLFLAACHPPSAGSPVQKRSAGVPSDSGWSASSWEERHDRMTFAVLPNMALLFQRFDRAPAPDMACTTCHGADAERVAYAMPHGLPPLDPARMPDPRSDDPNEAKMAKFMTDEVTPAMAALLGVPRFDPATGRGFSCFGCHTSR